MRLFRQAYIRQAVESAAESLGLGSLEITQKACPLFVSLAEEGWWDTEVTKLTAEEYLKAAQGCRS